jgi:hypothetical protein
MYAATIGYPRQRESQKKRRNNMNLSKKSIIVLMAFAVLAMLGSASVAHAGNQVGGPFLTDPYQRGGTPGEIAITASIVNTPDLPSWAVPPNYTSTPSYDDVITTLTFVMKLNPKRATPVTYSGVGKRKFDPQDPISEVQTTYFHLPADYFSTYKILGQAVYNFVKEKLPGSQLTSVVEVHDNVAEQLDELGGGLGTESPLYMWLEIEVVQP